MATRRRPRPCSWLDCTRTTARVRGAVAWRLVLGIALAAGLVWILTLPSVAPPEPAERAAAGPIAMRPAPRAEVATASPTPAAHGDSQTDPFAGVDVTNDSVLRHIAGIEEKSRGRQVGPARNPVRVAAAPAAPQPARVVAAPPPAREEATPDLRSAPQPPALTVAATVPAETPRAVDAPQPTPVIDSPVARTGDSSAQGPPTIAERPAAIPLTPPSATVPGSGGERVLVAALGKAAPAPSTTPPLRATNRTVPVFPLEAIRAGIQTGRVVVRLTIEADGRVSGTQIISASPTGFFERESRRALATWRYEPPGRTMLAEVELVFNRE